MAGQLHSRSAFHKVVGIFLALALGIGVAGYRYFESNRQEIRQKKQQELSGIAALKVREISRWRTERVGDGEVIARNPLLAGEIQRWTGRLPETEGTRDTLAFFRAIKEHFDYSDVLLLDAMGNVALSVSGVDRIDDELIRSMPHVVRSKQTLFFDLHSFEISDSIHCGVAVPILAQKLPDSPVIGILLLEIDPYRFLYPLVQSWPTPSDTSETLLVRRDGEEVVFLNELRHRKHTALSLRLSLNEAELPAAMAVLGKEGVVEGRDYRGIPVLAALRAIPDSPWFLIAKVDVQEVHAPIETHARWVSFVVFTLVAAAGVSLSFLWTRHYAKLDLREQEVLKKAHNELEQRVLERTIELWESKELFRQIAENIRDVFYVANADLERVLYISPAYEETWGRSRSSLIESPRSWLEALHPADREKVTGAMAALGPKGHALEYRIVRPDGSVRWIWDRGFPVHNESGTVYRYVGIAEDITERKKAEADLQLDEARFQALFELNQMTAHPTRGIVDFALDQQVQLTRSEIGFIGFMNEDESVLTLQAWSDGVMERCGTKDRPIHFPVEGSGLWAEAVRQRRPIVVNDDDTSHPGKKGIPGEHMALTRFMIVPMVEGNRVVALAAVANKADEYDSTDVRQLSLFLDGVWKLVERKRAEKALRESEGLASMGRALSGVAHDIKTPLVAIGGFSRLVRDHMEENHPDRGKLDIVIVETQRLENMVKDMLDFSRPLALHRSSADVDKLIGECLVLLEPVATGRRLTLERRSPHSPPWVSLDPMRMKQAIVNLVMNAIQASPEGETVTIQSFGGSPGAVIEVIDHGPGIPPEKREEIFSPFYTTRKEGTGLGLPIVKKIAEAHGGRVRILDNSDEGVTFRLEIPAS